MRQQLQDILSKGRIILLSGIALMALSTSAVYGQCNPVNGEISGTTFLDANMNGTNDDGSAISGVLVKAFSSDGIQADQAMTDMFGNYTLDGLDPNEEYRIEFRHDPRYYSGISGVDNKTAVRNEIGAACDVKYGLVNNTVFYPSDTELAITCFVKGNIGTSENSESVVGIKHNFTAATAPRAFARKSGTGSVWGLTYKSSTEEIFSAAFIKQHSALRNDPDSGEAMLDAIYTTDLANNNQTTLFTRLKTLGITLPTLAITNVDDCDYGNYVGRQGLGGLDISDDEKTLYVVNISNKSVVAIQTDKPTAANTVQLTNIDPINNGGNRYPFALKYYKNKLYIGFTETTENYSDPSSLSKAQVVEYDLNSNTASLVFETNYNKGQWTDNLIVNFHTKIQHWLTDIDFLNDDFMVIALNDRKGHRYCDYDANGDQLPLFGDQKGDILAVYKNSNNEWTLENNGVAAGRVGQGVGNTEGPGNGEFFGDDFFPEDEEYHNEVSLGSIYIIPGMNEVVSSVFDPLENTYSGGLHRYAGVDGSVVAANELYTDETDILFGKASGFGDITMIAAKPELEIGNLVWLDRNNNGVQDGRELGAAGINMELYDSSCNLVGETTTDANGYYIFNSSNVDLNNDNINDKLLAYNTYYVVISGTDYNTETSSIEVNNTTYILTQANTGFSSYPEGNDNDAIVAENVCNSIDGLPYVEVRTSEVGNNNHTFDIGLKQPGDFDLALKKELTTSVYARKGELATFKITVINQGEIGAKNIVVADLIPAGLAYEQVPNDDWSIDGDIATYTIDELAVDSETEIFISLRIKSGYTHEDFINYAEIKSADDQFNKSGNDIDSTPGGNFTEDRGGEPFGDTDNEVDDDGTIDEDDHDPAALRVFDLALTKKIVNPKSSYLSKDVVNFEIEVENQGNVAAKNIVVTDYIPDGLTLASQGTWEVAGDNIQNRIPTLNPNQRAKLYVSMEIGSDQIAVDLINVAEISQAFYLDNSPATDYDSDADTDKGDDMGGNPYDTTDNKTDDDGTVDEDDHDPALIKIERFDLALSKTTKAKNVQIGALVDFEITVFNQGSIHAGEITVVDYIPPYLEYVESEGWSMDPQTNQPICILTKDNGLLPATGLAPNASKTINITCKVKGNSPVGTVINEAEIASSKDFNGVDRTFDDFDSFADNVNENDNGGQINTISDDLISDNGAIDEDDHDPASLIVMSLLAPQSCYCLSNATVEEVGQFVNVFEVSSVNGETWEVVSASNFYQGLNAPGDTPDNGDYTIGEHVTTTDFTAGDVLLETDLGDGNSVYSIEGISLNGELFSVTLTNGGTPVTMTGGPCTYMAQEITGPAGVCATDVAEYCAPENTGSTYAWTLSGGGMILGATDEACVTVEWEDTPGGPFTLSVEQVNAGSCLDADTLDVRIGLPGGAMACIGDATISLDSDCSLEITPELVLQGVISDQQVYDVIVMDPMGTMLDEPIITGDHIGLPMTIKILDVCSGNSCWTSITVTDKLAPTLDVADFSTPCFDDIDSTFPVGVDNCGGVVTVELVSVSTESLSCNEDFTTEIVRVYEGTDENGNVSEQYTQTISLERVDVSAIVFPISRTVSGNNPLFCQQFLLDDDGNPSPLSAGVPTLNGISIFPYMDEYCSFGIDYSDNVVAPNGCVEKVMRTWTAFEWYCGQSIVETFIQEINIADQSAPVFAMPENFTVSTNNNNCTATVTLPAVEPVDDCSETFEVDVQYPDGFLNNQNGGSVDLELGQNQITYTVYDGCLNSSTQSFFITVRDDTPPVMVCDQNTVISLKADGTAYAPASVFDDGTITDCSPITLTVRRMDNGAACGINNSTFGEYVNFCCADVGSNVQVILQAIDADGNTNSCMVNVTIQDKNAPVITPPANVTIQCTDTYDLNDLAATFGVATASDNCMNPTITESYTSSINDCNTGLIIRTFTASDGNGIAVGSQFISVVNDFNFEESDITWPQDLTINNQCGIDLDPEDLDAPYDYPTFTTDACDMVEFAFADQQYTTSDDACFKILRRWMVMDMCQVQSDGSPLTFMYDQTIIVTNSIAPTITSSCDPVSVTVIDNCIEGEITLSATASDDCTADDNLQNSYNIDLNQDGSFDITVFGDGASISLTETLPVGVHTIVYQFEDRCGNPVNCSQEFSIINATPPIAYCQDLAIELTPMDTDGDNVIDAEMTFLDVELVGGASESLCGFPVTLSYDEEGDSTIAMFNCFDLGGNIVTVYVTDIFGNQSSCEATVIVQDNNDVDICPSPEDCIIFPEENVVVDVCLSDILPATLNSETVVTEPCVCDDYTITYVDGPDTSDPTDACLTFERTWTVTFFCFVIPQEYTFVQTITQLNAGAPVITNCPADVDGMSLDATCTAFVSVGIPTVSGACSFGIVTTNNSIYANNSTGAASGNYPVGTTTVIYTVTDACGNASTCSVDVTVNDLGAPNCETQDITVSIAANGNPVTIANDAVDNNSTDDCGNIVSYLVTPNTFDCTQLGDNVVTVTVTDQSGNSSTCTATVTVLDEVAPICNTQNLTFTLDNVNASVTITGEQVDDGSTDTCGEIVSYAVTPNTFTCDNVGDNTVTLTITDNNGNSSTCDATVTIVDGVDPLCVTQDIAIILDENGSYSLDASEIDNGSSDLCGDGVSLAVTPNSFDCTTLGDNTVTLTVTDNAGNTSQCTANVFVTDTIPPTAICNTNVTTITLFTTFPVALNPTLFDNGSFDACGNVIDLSITPSTVSCDDLGLNTIVLTVTDNNGNTATCESTILVTDNVEPTAIAQDITVSIGMDGIVVIDPLDVDNGSFDDCGMIVNYMVTPDTFDCTQLGDNAVVLKVTDESGNMATADATVTVEAMDELIAVCQDLTVYVGPTSTVSITPEDVDNGSMAPCGSSISLSLDDDTFGCNQIGMDPPQVITLTITDDDTGETATCTSSITVLDTILPTLICPDDLTFDCTDDISNPAIFGEVAFNDNCPFSLTMDTVVVENLNSCGLGTITRTYIGTDASGNSASCVQTITIEVSGENQFSEANIIWPVTPITIEDCSTTDPEGINSMPEIDTMEALCFGLTIEYMDMSVGMGTACLDTIERTWTVTDTCQVDGAFTFVQTLFIDDSAVPVIGGIPTDTMVMAGITDCSADLDLSGAFVMDCTSELIVTNDSPFANDNASIDASGQYPPGETIVNYTATDACGNEGTFQITITVNDLTDPLVTCQKVFPEITDDLTVTVTPDQYINTLSDNCSDSLDIVVFFVTDYTEGDDDITDNNLLESLTFDCDDVGVLMVVSIAFIDEAGNFFVCGAQTTTVDPNNFCGGTPAQNLIAGNVETYYGEAVNTTAINLNGTMDLTEMVEDDGSYEVADLPTGSNVNITPYNNNDPKKGLSTLDLLIIQKHIMQTELLPTPYDIIAADADHSEDVTGEDIIVIQKLLLGTLTEFPDNNSFRFVDAAYSFVDDQNPFASTFPESANLPYVYGYAVENFIGIKIGDVNGTYDGFSTEDGPETIEIFGRSAHDLRLDTDEVLPVNGLVEIPVYSDSYESLQALEMSLDLNSGSFVSIKKGLVDISVNDYAVHNNRSMKIAWLNDEAINVNENDVLFTIVVRAEGKTIPADILEMSIERNEFYKSTNDIAQLRFANEKDNNGLKAVLHQNVPNPWSNETMIDFEMVNDADYTFNFYDIDGRLIYTKSGFATKGINRITLNKADLSINSGVVVYDFISQSRKLTKRMMIIE